VLGELGSQIRRSIAANPVAQHDVSIEAGQHARHLEMSVLGDDCVRTGRKIAVAAEGEQKRPLGIYRTTARLVLDGGEELDDVGVSSSTLDGQSALTYLGDQNVGRETLPYASAATATTIASCCCAWPRRVAMLPRNPLNVRSGRSAAS